MARSDTELDERRRRAVFRATHRGTKEMDWILGRFAKSEVGDMAEAELTAFEQFLSLPDPDIEQWVMDPRAVRPTGETNAFVERLRRFHALGD